MARIPGPEQFGRVGLVANARPMRNAGAVGEAAIRGGEAIQRAGVQMFEMGESLKAASKKLQDERQGFEDAGFKAYIAANAPPKFRKAEEDAKLAAPDGGEGFYTKLDGDLGSVSNGLIDAYKSGGGSPSQDAISWANLHLAEMRGSYGNSAVVFENNASVKRVEREFQEAGRVLDLHVYNNPGDLQRSLAESDFIVESKAGVVPADILEKEKTVRRQTLAINAAKGMIATNPEVAARQLQSGQYDNFITAEDKDRLLASANSGVKSQMEALNAGGVIAIQKVRDVSDDAINSLELGIVPEDIEQVTALSSGTDYTARIGAALEDQPIMQEFALQKPAVRKSQIGVLQNTADPRKIRLLDRMERAHTKLTEMESSDPLALGFREGVAKKTAIDLNDPASIRARSFEADKVATIHGVATPLITYDEAVQIGGALAKLPPDQQAAQIAALTKNASPQAAMATAAMFNRANMPMLAHAAALSAQGTPQDVEAARLILKGSAYLKDKELAKALPSGESFDVELNDRLSGMFIDAPDARAQFQRGVKSAYVALAVGEENITGILDTDLLDKATEIVTGGSIEYDPTFLGRPQKFLAPRRGVTDGDFSDFIGSLTADDVNRMGVPQFFSADRVLDLIRGGGRLVQTGQDKWAVYGPSTDSDIIGDPIMRPITKTDGTTWELQWAPKQKVREKPTLEKMQPQQRSSLRYDAPELNQYASAVEQKYKLPPGLINAIKNAGEKSNSNQVSSASAQGVMQFIPANLKKYGVSDPTDPVQSIDASGRYLADAMKQYNGNIDAVIADYNGGPRQAQRVLRGEQPAAAETRNYLARVRRYLDENA